jgi:thiamine transport system ATP-binding protein
VSFLELQGVEFRYEDLLMRYDLAVAAGESVFVIGPSGAGKSTLLNLIAGFDRAAAGTVRIDGQDVTRWPPARRPVTMLFQEHNLFPHLDAAANVGLGIHPGLRLAREDHARVAGALAQVGLAGLGDRLPRQLSGGERQRVALARSLVRNTPILLLDEPFAALGPALRREMGELVDRLRAERGLTVLMVTHQLDELRDASRRAVFIDEGRILADGPIADLMQRPPDPRVAAYFG